MWRNVLCAVFVMALCFGLAAAETVKGKIVKVEGNKVTVATKADKSGKEYDATGAKVYRLVEGQKQEIKLADLKTGKGGVGATVEVDGNKVTEITVAGKKKKKN